MTYGKLYDAEKDEFHDPNEETYDRFGEHYSVELLKFVSDNARVDKKQTHLRVKKLLEAIDELIEKLDNNIEAIVEADELDESEGGVDVEEDEPGPEVPPVLQESSPVASAPEAGGLAPTGAHATRAMENAPDDFVLIPEGLPENYHEFYNTLRAYVDSRLENKKTSPNVFVICDMARSLDSIVATILLAELDRIGAIRLQGFITNFMPASDRGKFANGVLEYLALLRRKRSPEVALGYTATTETHKVKIPEFDNSDYIMANEDDITFHIGGELLQKTIRKNKNRGKFTTILLLSSFTDIAYFSVEYPELLTATSIDSIIMRSRYHVKDKKLVPDLLEENNSFDEQATNIWYKHLVSFFIDNARNIRTLCPSRCYRKNLRRLSLCAPFACTSPEVRPPRQLRCSGSSLVVVTNLEAHAVVIREGWLWFYDPFE